MLRLTCMFDYTPYFKWDGRDAEACCLKFYLYVLCDQFNIDLVFSYDELLGGLADKMRRVDKEVQRDGDMVLLRRGSGYHCGVLVKGQQDFLLHCRRFIGVSLGRLNYIIETPELRYKLIGIYRPVTQ